MIKLQYKNIPIYNQKEYQHFIYNIGVELKNYLGMISKLIFVE